MLNWLKRGENKNNNEKKEEGRNEIVGISESPVSNAATNSSEGEPSEQEQRERESKTKSKTKISQSQLDNSAGDTSENSNSTVNSKSSIFVLVSSFLVL